MRKPSKRAILAIASTLFFSAIIVLGVFQSQLNAKQYTVEEYFEITAVVEPMGKDSIEKNGTVWIIHSFWVTVKAVKGDAHNVVVESWAYAPLLDLGDIPKGEQRRDVFTSYSGAALTQENGLFYVTLRIRSSEASGKVRVNII